MRFPDAAEKVSHGRVVWYTTKVFAVFGGKVKGGRLPASAGWRGWTGPAGNR